MKLPSALVSNTTWHVAHVPSVPSRQVFETRLKDTEMNFYIDRLISDFYLSLFSGHTSKHLWCANSCIAFFRDEGLVLGICPRQKAAKA